MKEKTDTFFLIHNYNTVPDRLLEYCSRYLIMDASDDGKTKEALAAGGFCVQDVENTGHNITSYFRWFAEHYDELPEVVLLGKGNMIGRHCSEEYFEKVYRNTWFTFLYEEAAMRPRYSKATAKTLAENGGKDPSEGSIASLLSQSRYLEENNSWYMQTGTHPCRYFATLDDFLPFVYKDPVIPKYISFSPGACYIVRREQIRLHSPQFYLNLNKVMDYTLDPAFPAEAYIVERLLPVIFEESCEENAWMNDPDAFDEKLEEERKKRETAAAEDHRRFKRLRRLLKRP